jgi:hypothetical protein
MVQSTLMCNSATRQFLSVRSNLVIGLYQRTTSVLGTIADNSSGFVRWPGVGVEWWPAHLRPPMEEATGDLKSHFTTYALSLFCR